MVSGTGESDVPELYSTIPQRDLCISIKRCVIYLLMKYFPISRKIIKNIQIIGFVFFSKQNGPLRLLQAVEASLLNNNLLTVI